MTFDTSITLRHLHAELARLDLLLQREVRRWQRAGQDSHDPFRGLKISEAEATALAKRPWGVSWGQNIQLPSNDERAFQNQLQQAENALAKLLNADGAHSRLAHLSRSFNLNRFELDAWLIALAPTLDVRYEQVYGYLQDDVTRKRPTLNLVLNLLCDPGPERLHFLKHFAEEAPLRQHRLLEHASDEASAPLLTHTLAVDEALVAWLFGDGTPAGLLSANPTSTAFDEMLVAETLAAWWPPIQPLGEQLAVALSGADGAYHDATARWVAAQLQRPVLMLNWRGQATSTDLTILGEPLALALRDARLNQAVLYLAGWEACFNADGLPPRAWLAEVLAFPGPVVFATRNEWLVRGLERARRVVRWHWPAPTFEQRQAVWDHFLTHTAHTASQAEVDTIAAQFQLTSDQIRDAIFTAHDLALQDQTDLAAVQLMHAARLHSNPRLNELARKIKPRYGWDDIILPQDQTLILRELVSMVQQRARVLELWGLGEKLVASAGVTALFAGPPGTGKTMAAEVIAHTLGLDLFKIDLSTLVSKFIGETEKNLEHIFTEAQTSNAILFFDEADAIFGKRSEVKDAHDRYANLEVSYLLQRMEAYDGITILATNLRANLDEAFTRRLQFAVDFPFPDEADRARIWQTLFPPTLPRAADLDFVPLARQYKLAGGSIRNAIVNAAYMAANDGGEVTTPHLLHGIRREMQKMGRLLQDKV